MTPEETFGKQSYYGQLVQGAISHVEEKEIKIIKTAQDLDKLLSTVNPYKNEDISSLQVNWDQQYVIAVFAGLKNTGGYGLNLQQVEDGDEFRTYFFDVTTPDPKSNVSMAMTTPFLLLVVNHDDKEIKASFDVK